MLKLELFFFSIFLFTLGNSNSINEQYDLKDTKNKLWPNNRTLTWTLHHNHSIHDVRQLHQNMQQAFDDSARDMESTFRQAAENQNFNFNSVTVPNDNSNKVTSNRLNGKLLVTFPPNNWNQSDFSFDFSHSNNILSEQNQNNTQKLYGSKKTPVTTTARSTSKKRKTNTTKKPNAKKNIQIDDEEQLIHFEEVELVKVRKLLKEMQPDDSLVAFKNLSNIIKQSTFILPSKVAPILEQLLASYSKIKMTIKVGFTSSRGILSDFVIKGWHVMQHGMSKNDRNALMAIEKQTKTHVIKDLYNFTESSRVKLVQIQSQLINEATGGRTQDLLNKRNELEPGFLELLALVNNKSSECDINQGIVDLLEMGTLIKNISSSVSKNQTVTDVGRSRTAFSSGSTTGYEITAITTDRMKFDAAKLKEEMHGFKNRLERHRQLTLEKIRSTSSLRNKSEHKIEMLANITDQLEFAQKEMMITTAKLQDNIKNYTNKIREDRDHQAGERGQFWMFSWKVQDAHARHREKTVQGNINILKQRTDFLQNLFQKGSLPEIAKGLSAGKQALPMYRSKQIKLEQEYDELKKRFDKVSPSFYAIIQELENIYQSTGSVNFESIKMVDELCRAVKTAEESIISTYSSMRISLSSIDMDPDLIVPSVLNALRTLNMIDSYLDTKTIENIKRKIMSE